MALKDTNLILVPGSCKSTINERAQRSGSRTYLAYFDIADDENYVRSHLPIALYSRHPTDFAQLVTNIEVNDLDPGTYEDNTASRLWQATITYGPWTPDTDSESPIASSPRVRMAGTRVAKISDYDTDGNPILNTAGDPFDPPVERDATSNVLYVTRNEVVDGVGTLLLRAATWPDTINQAVWNGYAAKTLKLGPLTIPDREWDAVQQKYYYPMEYQFEVNPDGWDKQILNTGIHEVDPNSSSGALRNIIIEGQPATTPMLLDGNGRYLPPPVNKNNIIVNTYKIYHTMDYSVFQMDNLFSLQNLPQPPSS